jgi:hypothetical protein
MTRILLAIPGSLVLALGVASATGQAPPSQVQATAPAVASQSPTGMPMGTQTQLVRQYCTGCHSDRGKAGGLTLASFDAATIEEHTEVVEKMIRKLRAGMMPPAGAKPRRTGSDSTSQALAIARQNWI